MIILLQWHQQTNWIEKAWNVKRLGAVLRSIAQPRGTETQSLSLSMSCSSDASRLRKLTSSFLFLCKCKVLMFLWWLLEFSILPHFLHWKLCRLHTPACSGIIFIRTSREGDFFCDIERNYTLAQIVNSILYWRRGEQCKHDFDFFSLTTIALCNTYNVIMTCLQEIIKVIKGDMVEVKNGMHF